MYKSNRKQNFILPFSFLNTSIIIKMRLNVQPRVCIRRFASNSLAPHTTKTPPVNFDATKYRNWRTFEPSPKTSSTSFSVMTYNLLSQHYMWRQVFGYLDKNYLDWYGYRFPLINKTIDQFSCDIMCFQELETNVFNLYWSKNLPSTSKKYKTLFCRKPTPKYWGDQPIDCMDGVAIAVNTERFDILDSKEINIGDYIQNNPSQFDFTDDLSNRVLPRNTVAILLRLLDKVTGKIVYATNTHLYWSPLFNDVKVIQAKVLLSVLNGFIEEEDKPNPNVVMCGDFNSTPQSGVYSLLSSGKVDTTKSSDFDGHYYGTKLTNEPISDGIIKNPFRLASAYESLIEQPQPSATTDSIRDDQTSAFFPEDSQCLKFTTFTKSFSEVLDHIWYSESNFKVRKILGAVDQNYCDRSDVIGFPNQQFPSDHIPLVSEIDYRE